MIRRLAVVALVAAAALLFAAAAEFPSVGHGPGPAATRVSPRYIEQGPAETGADNMVTGVLADYRGYDTLGELTVIFTAGLACLLILGVGASRPEGEDEE